MNVWYETFDGQKIRPVPGVLSVDYTLVFGDVGVLEVATAAPIDRTKDRRISVFRKGQREITTFLDRFDVETDQRGQTDHVTAGRDVNTLLSRRIVFDFAGTSGAEKTATPGAMMGTIVDEQMVNDATDSARNYANMTIRTSAHGTSLSKAFAWRSVLTVLQDIQAASRSDDDEVFFGVSAPTNTAYEFRTYTGQPGNDRTVHNVIVFSQAWGNLTRPNLSLDYSEEANAIYVGGQGTGVSRVWSEVEDIPAQANGPISRKERFYSATQASSGALASEAGKQELTRRRARLYFSGIILSTPTTPYGGGGGWKLGDRVPVRYDGQSFDAIVRAVRVQIGSNGQETISARVEALI